MATKTDTKAIKVISRPPIFRRAGRLFTQEPTQILLPDLTDEQIKALRAETNLVVIDCTIEAKPAEGDKA